MKFQPGLSSGILQNEKEEKQCSKKTNVNKGTNIVIVTLYARHCAELLSILPDFILQLSEGGIISILQL